MNKYADRATSINLYVKAVETFIAVKTYKLNIKLLKYLIRKA